MIKVRRKFILSALIALFILLTVLLSVISIINFTMASEDADRITESIERDNGFLTMKKDDPKNAGAFFGDGKLGPMGPDSPEINSSIRYFTVRFDKSGNGEIVDFRISAVTEEESIEWAKSLIGGKTGWTHGTYRYRVYEVEKLTYVTVIDQGRELISFYRILNISVIGEILVLLISAVILVFVGRRVFKPLEDADRKQRKFIAEAENEFKLPITIINANTEIIEKESGVSDQTAAIRRQTKKMTSLVDTLGSFAIFDDKNSLISECDLSGILSETLDSFSNEFERRKIAVSVNILPGVTIRADSISIRSLCREIATNAARYSLSKATFCLTENNGRIQLSESNDADLLSGDGEEVFERFVTLSNASSAGTSGLGLSFVREIVRSCNGRTSAVINDGTFTLLIEL